MKRGDRNIRKTVKRVEWAIMLTRLGYKTPNITLLKTQKFDKKGNLWFLSDQYNLCNQDLMISDNTIVIYKDAQKSTLLNFQGKCSIIDDESIIIKLYKKDEVAYAKHRKEETLTALKFNIEKADFWDPANRVFKTMYES